MLCIVCVDYRKHAQPLTDVNRCPLGCRIEENGCIILEKKLTTKNNFVTNECAKSLPNWQMLGSLWASDLTLLPDATTHAHAHKSGSFSFRQNHVS